MEKDRAFAEILHDCLEAVEAGQASVEDCLARYPQHAAQLEDLLRLSDQARSVPLPPLTPEMLAAGEQRLLQAAQARAEETKSRAGAGLLGSLSRRFVQPAVAGRSSTVGT